MQDKPLFAFVTVACAVPLLAYALGLDMATERLEIDANAFSLVSQTEREEAPFLVLRGALIHTLLEWTGVCVAAITALLSLVHYFLKRDVTTPVIATALMFSGVLDAMRIISVDRLAGSLRDPLLFTAVTWSASRVFLAAILIAGTLPFVLRKTHQRPPKRDVVDFVLLAIMYLLAATALIYYARVKLAIPDRTELEVYSVSQTLAMGGLLLFVLCGVTLAFYRRRNPSLFASALQASLIPHIAAQLCLLTLSTRLYDAGFNLASVYKLLGYLVPIVGLVLDYRRVSGAEAELKTTERQLDIARDIQKSLLPTEPPGWKDLEAAGFSESSEAVGGDYFDYLTLPDGGRLTIIADVSGHDLGAALLMANGRAYLKAMAEDTSDVRTLARRFNAFVTRDARGRRFVTGMLVKVAVDGQTEIIAAGHSGYLVHPDESIETLEQSNVPFGVMDEFESEPLRLTLEPGDTLTLLTDGLQELPNPEGEQFGLERVARAVAAPAGTSCRTSLDRVRSDATRWAAGVDPFDDMTVVLIRRQPPT